MTAPQWTVSTLTPGAGATIDAYAGKPLLMLFWNIGCAGCTGRAVPAAKRFAKQYPDLQVVGVHTTFEGPFGRDPEDVKKVVDYLNIEYPIVLDEGHVTFDAYEAGGTPHWVIIDADGDVRKSFFGSMAGSMQRLEYSLAELFE